MKKTPQGFIALISAMIISATLVLVALSGSLTGFYLRSDVSDAESKESSYALADACADEAFLRLASDPTYSGSAVVPVGSASCTIGAITTNSGVATFEVQGISWDAATNFKIVYDINANSVSFWQEIPNF